MHAASAKDRSDSRRQIRAMQETYASKPEQYKSLQSLRSTVPVLPPHYEAAGEGGWYTTLEAQRTTPDAIRAMQKKYASKPGKPEQNEPPRSPRSPVPVVSTLPARHSHRRRRATHYARRRLEHSKKTKELKTRNSARSSTPTRGFVGQGRIAHHSRWMQHPFQPEGNAGPVTVRFLHHPLELLGQELDELGAKAGSLRSGTWLLADPIIGHG